jgi:hypothetical protein
MKKILVGKFDGGSLYFVPGNPQMSGIVKINRVETPIDFWSFIDKRKDVEPIKETATQMDLWSMRFSDQEWLRKFYPQGAKTVDDTYNPYNEKAAAALDMWDAKTARIFKRRSL